MSAIKENRIKNKSSIITSFIAGFVTILFLTELFQGYVAYLFGAENLEFVFNGIIFSSRFILPGDLHSFSYIFVLSSNVFFILFFVELAIYGLKKSPLGFLRYTLILFLLILIGYLIINIFYGAFSVFVNINLNNDWLLLSEYMGITGKSKIAYMFFVVIILLAYLNFVSRRILKYINI